MKQEQYERAAEIVALQKDRKTLLRWKKNNIALELFYGHPIVKTFSFFPLDNNVRESMNEASIKIIDTYVNAIDNRIAELEKEFEEL